MMLWSIKINTSTVEILVIQNPWENILNSTITLTISA